MSATRASSAAVSIDPLGPPGEFATPGPDVRVTVQEESGGLPYVEVDLKGERISLEDVRHRGRIEGELVLMGDATHED